MGILEEVDKSVLKCFGHIKDIKDERIVKMLYKVERNRTGREREKKVGEEEEHV